MLKSNDVEIVHSLSPFIKNDSSLYTTQITNKGTSAFKVNRFTSYSKQFMNKLKSRPKHSNIIGGWFTDNDFRMWYGQNSEWVKPNGSVSDLRNYGGSCFWLYEFQTDEGQVFWVSRYKD